MTDIKMTDIKMTDQVTGNKNAKHEIASDVNVAQKRQTFQAAAHVVLKKNYTLDYFHTISF